MLQRNLERGRVSAGLVGLLVVIGLVVLSFFWTIGIKNGAVERDEGVTKAWADVESQYQRRLDLIPNLVQTVKGAADFESETLQAVTNARASVGQIQVSGEKLLDDPDAMRDFAAKQQNLGTALSRLLVVAERYPQLTATRSFADLQHQLEGTENRIQRDREQFNLAVKDYNAYIRKIPNKWLLDAEEFQRRESFQAVASADQAPKVNFGDG